MRQSVFIRTMIVLTRPSLSTTHPICNSFGILLAAAILASLSLAAAFPKTSTPSELELAIKSFNISNFLKTLSLKRYNTSEKSTGHLAARQLRTFIIAFINVFQSFFGSTANGALALMAVAIGGFILALAIGMTFLLGPFVTGILGLLLPLAGFGLLLLPLLQIQEYGAADYDY
jgi:hypothetical protein